ncbi:unnamed protein product [Blepharisma stoltei]|uniref:Eukaryotic translation initiation factor 4E n=1 Tax=Blepharisma stoltei TaxID=1481888 RepID=A0AAU9IRR2_9CILI|nr:unnamed protein product [Blepharisma stoltei]
MGHDLEYPWDFYVTRNKKKTNKQKITLKAWEERLKKINTFKTVEDFWHVYNNIKVPTDIKGRGDYFLFREGILPEWEDPRNAQGGAWSFKTEHLEKINEQWLNSELALIGCQFLDLSPHICGAELSVRVNRFRIAIWTDSIEERYIQSVGLKLKDILGREAILEFRKHFDEKVLFTL